MNGSRTRNLTQLTAWKTACQVFGVLIPVGVVKNIALPHEPYLTLPFPRFGQTKFAIEPHFPCPKRHLIVQGTLYTLVLNLAISTAY